MHPTLFHLGSIPIQTYGFMMTMAHLLGIALLLWIVRRQQRPIDPYLDLIFAVLVSGVIGARLFYAATHWAEFQSQPWNLFSVWKGGVSVLGGFMIAFPTYLLVIYRKKLSLWETSDFGAPIFLFSLALIRIGCFAAGCCHGHPTTLPWGMLFTSSLIPREMASQALHPTQLYEALPLLLLSIFFYRELFRNRWMPGFLATGAILSYAILRFTVDLFRGDLVRWGPLTLSQLQSLVLLAAGTCVLLYLRTQYRTLIQRSTG